MSGYYVLALENGKVRRHEAQSLPEAQKLMRKHGPSAAIFTGMRCFGSIPGIDRRNLDTLIVAAREGGMGECAFCDTAATSIVDGDPVCSKHAFLEEEGEVPDADDEFAEAAQDEPAPPAPQPAASAPAAPPAAPTCLWTNCTAPPSAHPSDDPTLAPYCGKHRGLAKSHGTRPGQPTPLCTTCGKNPRGAQSHRTPEEMHALCTSCRHVSRNRVLRAAKAKAPKPSASKPSAPKSAKSAAPSGLRDAFEQLLLDHDLVETIGREVCVALASRVKGGAR